MSAELPPRPSPEQVRAAIDWVLPTARWAELPQERREKAFNTCGATGTTAGILAAELAHVREEVEKSKHRLLATDAALSAVGIAISKAYPGDGDAPDAIAAKAISERDTLREELRLATEWRPMESAPKDGTRIVAIGHAYGDPTKGYHDPVLTWFYDGCWQAESSEDECGSYLYLTHWLPLPAAPAGKEGVS